MRSENRIQEVFACIKAEEKLKTSTKEFLQTARRKEAGALQDRKKAVSAFRPALWQIAGILCAVLMMVCGVSIHIMLHIPVSYVSIDINPSIELELNRLDRVISAKAYNEDGEEVLGGISVSGKYYTDAIETLVESSGMEPYLAENALLVFTVASKDEKRESELVDGVGNCSGCTQHGGRSMGGDVGLVTEAHENGFSLGKYTAYKILQQYEPSVTASDCHNMSMSELHDLIEEHESHHSGQTNEEGMGGHGHREDHGHH